MEDEGRRAVLDDADVLLAPGRDVTDHRRPYDATYRHRVDAGERWLPCSEGWRVGPGLGAAVAAGSPRAPGFYCTCATPGDDRAAPMYRSAGVRPAERDTVTRVG